MTRPRAAMPLTSRKSTPDEQTKAGIRWLCQTDLYALASQVLYADARVPMTDGFHKPLCRFVQTTPYPANLYLLARDHNKTGLITIARNVQRVLAEASTRILVASNKAENAEAMLAELKGHLVNPVLLWAFPDILYADPTREAEKWTGGQIIVKRRGRPKEPTVDTIGAEGELTSKHYDHATLDDLVGFENSQTKEQLQRTIRWWQTAQSLLEPWATQDIVGTPWAHGDLYMWLLEQRFLGAQRLGVYRQPCYAIAHHPTEVRTDSRGNLQADELVRGAAGELVPAFPERYSCEALQDKKRAIGAVMWAAQWLLNPTDDETAVFPRSRAVIVPRDRMPDPANLWIVMTVDPAISTKAWADYSAVAVVGFDPEGKMNVLDLRRGRMPESELVETVYDCWGRTPGIRVIGFEAIGFAKIFRREFTRAGETRGYLPITTLERDTKITKNVRIRALQPLWEHGEIVLAADLPALDDLLEEAERFRLYRESLHDDLLDALADALQLRIRPHEREGGLPESLIDDPEALHRQRWEWRTQQERQRQGLPALDRSALRVAYAMHRYYENLERENEAATLGVGTGEFFG